MAEPFGIATGALNIVTAFTYGVDCFNYVKVGSHFGRDSETLRVSLCLTQLRLARWGEAVKIYQDPKLGKADTTTDETNEAHAALIQILVLFDASNKISKKHKLDQDDVPGSPTAFEGRLGDICRQRQKAAGWQNKAAWALYRKKEYEMLIASITALVDGLERLFPPPSTAVAAFAAEERDAVTTRDEEDVLQRAQKQISEALCQAEKEHPRLFSGSSNAIRKLTAEDSVKVLVGNSIAGDWKGGNVPASRNEIGEANVKGSVKVHTGDRIGYDDFML